MLQLMGAPAMDTWQALGGVALLLLVAYLTWHFAVYGAYGTRKPGWPIYPFVGYLPDLFLNYWSLFDHQTQAMEKSPTMSFFGATPGLKWLNTANPAHLQHILKDNFTNYPKGEDFVQILLELLGHGILTSDGEAWKVQRKIASYEFSTNSLRTLMVTTVHDQIQNRLLPLLSSLATPASYTPLNPPANGRKAVTSANATSSSSPPLNNQSDSSSSPQAHLPQVVDMQDVFLRYTFDSICRVGFGTDPGSLAPGFPEVPFVKSFDRAAMACILRAMLPPPVWKTMRALNVGYERQLAEDVKVINAFAHEVIEKRKKAVSEGKAALVHDAQQVGVGNTGGGQGGSDLLSRLIALGEKDGGDLFSDSFLRDSCINFIMAGRDTSAVASTWLLWVLTWHPEVETKIVAELRAILEQRDGAPENRHAPFSYEELKRMTYLHAAINETLRLYPPLPVDQKTCLRDDTLPDGTFCGAGWRVLYSLYAVGRMTRVWGPDAAEFKPERWLTPGGEVRLESPFKFIAFNAGPRLCLGKEFAYIQIKSIISHCLLKFRFHLLAGHKVSYVPSITLFMNGGLPMTISVRE